MGPLDDVPQKPAFHLCRPFAAESGFVLACLRLSLAVPGTEPAGWGVRVAGIARFCCTDMDRPIAALAGCFWQVPKA